MDCRECVSSCHIRWLGYTAFRRVLGRKQARRAPASAAPAPPLRRGSAHGVLSAGALRAQRAHPRIDETACGASSRLWHRPIRDSCQATPAVCLPGTLYMRRVIVPVCSQLID
jgi:hypothetical protein